MSLPDITEKINFNNVPMNYPSLCIPRVLIKINEYQIRKIFDELELGIIKKIDIVTKYTQNGEKYNRIFVHFKKWFNNENAIKARERVLSGNEIKIIYEQPFFWKVSAYREPIVTQNQTQIREAQIRKNVTNIIAQLPIQSPRNLQQQNQIKEDIEFKSQTPIFLPPAPKQLKLEDINIDNANEISIHTNINEKTNRLLPIDNKLLPFQVNKILFKK